jgi:hypothetical protein
MRADFAYAGPKFDEKLWLDTQDFQYTIPEIAIS